MNNVKVHAYMVYRCKKCQKAFRMWCEEGVEEGGYNSQPTPFVIACKCGGFAKDVSGLFRINKTPMINGCDELGSMNLPEGESYFAYDKKALCAVAKIDWRNNE